MQCPHGKPVYEKLFYGLRRFIHEDGGNCVLLNGMSVSCDEIAGAQMQTALENRWNDYTVRMVYSAYKLSPYLRFFYLERICSLSGADFFQAFKPVKQVLISEDEPALNGLYVMELYFAFTGICERISAVNEDLARTSLYRFLSAADAPRFISQENPITRSYAVFLNKNFSSYKNRLCLPGLGVQS